MKRIFILSIIFFSVFLFPGLILAEVEVSPRIIDQKAKPREVFDFTINIQNNTDSSVWLYPIVNDISKKESVRGGSLAEWVVIPRGRIELAPGEEKEISLSIDVNLNAKPGKYYGTVIFSRGSTRPEAEANALKTNQPEVLLSLEVEEHIVERAQLVRFLPERNLFLTFPIGFVGEIENIGNREIKPTGFIHIYDRKGEEIASLNLGNLTINPNSKESFSLDWKTDKGFGRFKAIFSAEYGDQTRRELVDTVYFWILPWYFLIVFFFFLIIICLLLTWLILRKLQIYYFKKYKAQRLMLLKNKKLKSKKKGKTIKKKKSIKA